MNKQTNLYLTDEDRRKLQELAALTTKKSMSDVVRNLIDHAYNKFITSKERPQ
jgi:predicted DNA-binding protein